MNRRTFFAALAIAPVVALAPHEPSTREFDRRCMAAWYRSRGISESEVEAEVAACLVRLREAYGRNA